MNKIKINQFGVGHEIEKRACYIFGGLIYRKKKGKVKLFCKSRINSMYYTLRPDG